MHSKKATVVVPRMRCGDFKHEFDLTDISQVSILKGHLDVTRVRNQEAGVVLGFTAFGQGCLIAGEDGVHLHRLYPKVLRSRHQARGIAFVC